MLRAIFLLSLVATATSIHTPAAPASRLAAPPQTTLRLRGGFSLDQIKYEPKRALQVTGAAMTVFGLLAHPDLPVPIMNIMGEVHDTRAELMYNDKEPETQTFRGALRWVAMLEFWVAALLFALANTAMPSTRKIVCQINCVFTALNLLTVVANGQPTKSGVHVLIFLMAVVNGIAGFGGAMSSQPPPSAPPAASSWW
ncbi:hypothetical protein T484DRAFT_1935427 [Baffinella frigidus]|nr:hypothetical protein T484DRAFT_1935427 [Cryptophyta sp. CCMP2293]|mmetsp:Transcript_8085/g.18767  ORF Transcript_8085/g.18767 Transcript_8085/m.18767 type:complete len:198 (-) Transcript_8085:221-814(-)|eukprot:CAMPEP_0180139822 /NCGR_PEP_ID=MMETSP0986-20121125/13794_1 /TAXON_ID=697907 /ORGANISM="non described non described, Strain CCMP2293" /LENGTH=197 /DNA_ID=CAMNT_0022082063 /DNA_START=20 /DNA_END=613 /DNA_ORIENTATION=-